MALPKDAPILIVGAGTWGLSTALHLLRRSYTNVTLVDPHAVPSPQSAANDINKIIQTSYGDALHTALATEALALWRHDPVFAPHMHEVGVVMAASSRAPLETLHARNAQRRAEGRPPLRFLAAPADFRAVLPALTGPLQGWRGYYQPDACGWAHAAHALEAAARECARLGATFVLGRVVGLLYGGDGTVLGARTDDGRELRAQRTVVSAGASSIDALDFAGQLLAKCWTLAHITLTPLEAAALKGAPVPMHLEKGFFFEPDGARRMKICNEFPGYTNVNEAGLSVPVFRSQMPLEAEKGVRSLLRETIPELAERKFSYAGICWCTDTPDRNFLICEHPQHAGLVIATGDSGKAFKFMPNIGKYIGNVVELGDAGLSPEHRHAWRWRPETAQDRDDSQGRWGGSGTVGDLKDVAGWTGADDSAADDSAADDSAAKL